MFPDLNQIIAKVNGFEAMLSAILTALEEQAKSIASLGSHVAAIAKPEAESDTPAE